jgi:hypothetical protein
MNSNENIIQVGLKYLYRAGLCLTEALGFVKFMKSQKFKRCYIFIYLLFWRKLTLKS